MLKVFTCIGVLALLVLGGLFFFQKSKAQAAIQQELTSQQSEKQECEKHLTLFYQAWKKYKADHKGAEPPTVVALVPKYIPNPALLVCPTAQRWIKNRKAIDHGNVTINKQEYTETYGFQWLSPNASYSIKRQGDKAPLVSCSAHEEGLYFAVFNKKPPLGAFDADKRKEYAAELQNTRPLVVRRNGTVENLSASEE